jgi:mono/diheme cytochrome c family protein
METKTIWASSSTAPSCSHLAGFGVWMTGPAAMIEELRVTRYLAPTIGLLAVLAPALAHAQTNLDQGKSASQIFAGACAECHRAPQGLAKGRNSAALTDFLREHYTTNGQQAAALAAYVLGGRGAAPIGATEPSRGQKPAPEHASTSAEEPKPPKHQAKQSPKPEEDKGRASAKLRQPAGQDTKPEPKPEVKPQDEAKPGEQPSVASPEATPSERRPAIANRNRRKEPKTPQSPEEPAAIVHEPAAIDHAPASVAEPATTELPSQNAPGQSARAPTDAAPGESGETAPVPRDNIPD